ncbi:hypothetical protein [Marinobacter sp. X15-166B]|uniref:hypothetical protein n=1 Tax=Marinobacter sp. X15-166B TaxID=1897620 RepID=UPI00085C5191|nr:hypothetical protein [Marinobacter sp. X15-166B]OEY66792.1 hypothetical protein BG841_10225 [Marinobacter sp. X15-166B]
MATVNPWARFQKLLPRAGRYTVTIDQVNTDGTSSATRRDGQLVRLKGGLVEAGKKAWVEGEQIIGEAPDLPTTTQYV